MKGVMQGWWLFRAAQICSWIIWGGTVANLQERATWEEWIVIIDNQEFKLKKQISAVYMTMISLMTLVIMFQVSKFSHYHRWAEPFQDSHLSGGLVLAHEQAAWPTNKCVITWDVTTILQNLVRDSWLVCQEEPRWWQLKHSLFSSIFGEDSQLTHIFQMGQKPPARKRRKVVYIYIHIRMSLQELVSLTQFASFPPILWKIGNCSFWLWKKRCWPFFAHIHLTCSKPYVVVK